MKDFNPPTPCGVGPGQNVLVYSCTYFNPPTPCGVGHPGQRPSLRRPHFNPPTPCGVGRLAPAAAPSRLFDFNPPTPCGVGLYRSVPAVCTETFQSTHPVWGGTMFEDRTTANIKISIHPPRVGWDLPGCWPPLPLPHFNPPTPCGVGPPSR